jgi:hypothetical protein
MRRSRPNQSNIHSCGPAAAGKQLGRLVVVGRGVVVMSEVATRTSPWFHWFIDRSSSDDFAAQQLISPPVLLCPMHSAWMDGWMIYYPTPYQLWENRLF